MKASKSFMTPSIKTTTTPQHTPNPHLWITQEPRGQRNVEIEQRGLATNKAPKGAGARWWQGKTGSPVSDKTAESAADAADAVAEAAGSGLSER